MDSYTWTLQYRSFSKGLYTSDLSRHWMYFKGLVQSNERERESMRIMGYRAIGIQRRVTKVIKRVKN